MSNAVADRKQARIVADAAKREAKPYVLVLNEQVRGLGGKYRSLQRTEIRYSSEASLKAGLKRRYPGVAWKNAENSTSFIFTPTSDNGSKRIQVVAYKSQLLGYSVQISLQELVTGNGSTKQ